MNSLKSQRQFLHRILTVVSSIRIRSGVVAALFLCAAALLIAPRAARADEWALLIGIDQYADSNRISSLGGAAADARALAKTLTETAGFPEDHIQLLVSDGETRPTRVEILNALTRLAANANPGDTVFVLYSGHGIEIDGTSYLLPYDTSALSNADIVDSALETEKFTSRLRLIKAHAIVLAFDMCRSDPRSGSRAVGAETDNKLSTEVVRGLDFANITNTRGAAASANTAAPSIAITFYSCSPNERSYEDALKERGYFSEYLEKGLRGAAADASGKVRVSALAKYLEKSVHAAVAQAENGASQTPYPEMKGPGVEEFVLAHPVTASLPPLSTSRPDKMVLRYRAKAGQSERIRGTASLTVAGSDGRINTTEFDKITYSKVDPQTGEITATTTVEHQTMSSSAGIQSTDTPETSSLTLRPNGKLVSVKSSQGTAESDAGNARLRQATGLVFSDKPVGLGDKWSYDYAADKSLGTPAAHADFEIVSVSIVDDVRQFKVKMSYSERGAAPIVSHGTFVIDPETGDGFSGEADISGLVIAGLVCSGKLQIERLEGGASVK